MRRAQAAQALVWLTLCLPVLIGVAGLAIDAGLALSARRELQSLTDGAARAGATRIDLVLLRRSGGDQVELNTADAYAAANLYLDERVPNEPLIGSELERRVDVAPQRVQVALQVTVPTAFMRIVRIESVPIGATADATVEYGIHGPGGN
jgi:Flp pilus assembly protein TadG